MPKTINDVVEDLIRDNYNDHEVDRNFEVLRQCRLAKGLPYVEVVKSKTLGTLKYLLKEEPSGELTICDLDNGTKYSLNLGPLEKRIGSKRS